eukprot:m.145278 g.145278  ORF g.145278 m.145278 type:complete len:53 (-) comp13229_c0_seq4:3487-3645(-)
MGSDADDLIVQETLSRNKLKRRRRSGVVAGVGSVYYVSIEFVITFNLKSTHH